jgi:3-oxoacyl-(acyl-carrier-protein) synthase
MAAVLDACRLLQTRQVDLMLAGATDRTMDPATFSKFSAIGALSPTHSTPFDARANGFVMGEGAGVLLLKRLGDAIRDGDEVHAVIRGIGGSSDGRGKGITAPSQRGQVQAIARAYNRQVTLQAPFNWWRRTALRLKLATQPNCPHCPCCGTVFQKEITLQSAQSNHKLVI